MIVKFDFLLINFLWLQPVALNRLKMDCGWKPIKAPSVDLWFKYCLSVLPLIYGQLRFSRTATLNSCHKQLNDSTTQQSDKINKWGIFINTNGFRVFIWFTENQQSAGYLKWCYNILKTWAHSLARYPINNTQHLNSIIWGLSQTICPLCLHNNTENSVILRYCEGNN